MTSSLTSGQRFTAGIVSVLLISATAAAPAFGARQDTSPPPAPIVRIPRRPPAQAPSTVPGSAPGTASPGTPSVVHRPRPVSPVSPDALHPYATTAPAPNRAIPPTHPPTQGSAGASSTVPPKPRTPSAPQTTSVAGAAGQAPAAEHKTRDTVNGLNRNVVVIDPGHGGTDSGARIGDSTLEKNVTLALALRLRSLLLARGFTVVLTRDSDAATLQTSPSAAPTPLTLDDRAGIANHAHAAACLLLHATGRGTGLHLYSSEMDPLPAEPAQIPWLTAQGAWVPASKALETQLVTALGRSHIPLLASAASVRPVDSLTCPALVLELAPENPSTPASVDDAGYQERVAAALAGALVFWENAVQAPPRLPAPVREHPALHHTDAADPGATPVTPPSPEPQP